MTDEDWRSAVTRTDERATKALEQIAAHEERCNARYTRIEDTLTNLQGRWFWGASSLVSLLLILVAYLLINGRPWA